MSARVLSQLVVAGFIILGLMFTGIRYQSRRESQLAVEDSSWRLTYSVKFEANESLADEPDATLRIGLPTDRAYAEILNEEYSHPGLKDRIAEYGSSGNRELILTTRHGDKYEVRAEFEIRLHPEASWHEQQRLESLSDGSRLRYMRSDEEFPVQDAGVQKVIRQSPKGESSEGEILQWLFDYCANDLQSSTKDDEGGADRVDWVLANKKATALGRARALVTLCRVAGLPARLVTGFELRQIENPQPHIWIEVFYGHRWVPFDPTHGYARHMPADFLPVRRGGDSVVRAPAGAKQLLTKYSLLRLPPEKSLLQSQSRRPAQIFDLTRLPVKMHEVMSLMLLLPLGALITAFFRNVIGIRTFGTFSPALLAASFIYAAWGTGIVILAVVMIAGLAGRFLLERLHLLMVPRLSIVLTLIILCVVFCVSLLDYLAWTHSGQSVLLPLVILTILIERFHVTAEEDGIAFALQLVVGTTIVAAFCYLLLKWDDIGRLMLIYPEAHFLTIAMFIIMGRYSGYRLVELWRFRDLVKPKKQ